MTEALSGRDTIVAPATPPGRSGVALIRLSGPEAIRLAEKLFVPYKGHPSPANMPGYTLAPGVFAGVDEVMLSLFRAPHGYTGEDSVEISCHGGLAVRQAIVEALQDAGARLAEAGEFSKRAFLNGKLDLIRAEGVIALIEADARAQAQAAFTQMQGGLSLAVADARASVLECMGQVELILEFPEHEETKEVLSRLTGSLEDLAAKLSALAQTWRRGRLIAEGVRVVLAGRPNAGKSSLFNALVGSSRAIVTDIPGTTRDTIEAEISLDGYLVTLVDTAGATETEDPVEREGVRRAQEAERFADFVFYVVPAEDVQEVDGVNVRRLEQSKKPHLVCLTKADRVPQLPVLPYEATAVSSVDGRGLNDLRGAIRTLLEKDEGLSTDGLFVTNERHVRALLLASELLQKAAQGARAGLPYDVVAVLLRQAADALFSLTGEQVDEALVDEIFQRFCVGK